jgi:NADH-quinone oxidoreductase subunit J
MDWLPGLVPPFSFIVLAIIAVFGALGVVAFDKITHSALSLALCFLSVAGLYVLLQADFLFAVQILVYVGAVMVLIVFAIMLTREVQTSKSNASNRQMALAGLVSVVVLGMLVWVMLGTAWPNNIPAVITDSTRLIADALFNQFVLPFEIVSLVLLVAMIGAIVIAREKQ